MTALAECPYCAPDEPCAICLGLTSAAWDETKHPRHPKGDPEGGEFATFVGLQGYERGPGKVTIEGERPRIPVGHVFQNPPVELDAAVSDWANLREQRPEKELVNVHELVPTQDQMSKVRVQEYVTELRQDGNLDELLDSTRVVEGDDSRLYVADGHNRVGAALELGYTELPLPVIRPNRTAAAWDENKHPRHSAGTPEGGEFASKTGRVPEGFPMGIFEPDDPHVKFWPNKMGAYSGWDQEAPHGPFWKSLYDPATGDELAFWFADTRGLPHHDAMQRALGQVPSDRTWFTFSGYGDVGEEEWMLRKGDRGRLASSRMAQAEREIARRHRRDIRDANAMLPENQAMAAAAWDESKHKRHPAGTEEGGEFARKQDVALGNAILRNIGYVDLESDVPFVPNVAATVPRVGYPVVWKGLYHPESGRAWIWFPSGQKGFWGQPHHQTIEDMLGLDVHYNLDNIVRMSGSGQGSSQINGMVINQNEGGTAADRIEGKARVEELLNRNAKLYRDAQEMTDAMAAAAIPPDELTAEQFNQIVAEQTRELDRYEEPLTRVYERLIRGVGRAMAKRFRKLAPQAPALAAAGWDESKHPRDPGGEGGGQFVEKGAPGVPPHGLPPGFPQGIFEPADSVKFWPQKMGAYYENGRDLPMWKAILDDDGNEVAFWFVDPSGYPHHAHVERALGMTGWPVNVSGWGNNVDTDWLRRLEMPPGGPAQREAEIEAAKKVPIRHRRDIGDAAEMVTDDTRLVAAAGPPPADWNPPTEREALAAAGWDESKHPRHPAGSDLGGEFAARILAPITMNVGLARDPQETREYLRRSTVLELAPNTGVVVREPWIVEEYGEGFKRATLALPPFDAVYKVRTVALKRVPQGRGWEERASDSIVRVRAGQAERLDDADWYGEYNEDPELALRAAAMPPAEWNPPTVAELLAAIEAVDAAADKAEKIQAAAFEQIVEGILLRLGISFEVRAILSQAILNGLGARVVEMIEGIRVPVARAIANSYLNGLSVPQTADAIMAAVDGLSQWQATQLARNDLVGIANGGSLTSARILKEKFPDVGLGYKEWLATPDERTRPSHHDASGQRVPLETPFVVGGAALAYPGDPTGPDGEVINCRCTVLYYEEPKTAVTAAGPWALELTELTAAFVEAKHPRHPKGTEAGGEFAPKMVSRADSSARELQRILRRPGFQTGVFYKPTDEFLFESVVPPVDPTGLPFYKFVWGNDAEGNKVTKLWTSDDMGAPHHQDVVDWLAAKGYKFEELGFGAGFGLEPPSEFYSHDESAWPAERIDADVQAALERNRRKVMSMALAAAGELWDEAMCAAAWEELKHPRHPRGTHLGGKFAPKNYYYGARMVVENGETVGYQAFRMERGTTRYNATRTDAGPIRDTYAEAAADAQFGFEEELAADAAAIVKNEEDLVAHVDELRSQPGQGTRYTRTTKPVEGPDGEILRGTRDALQIQADEAMGPGHTVEEYDAWTDMRMRELTSPELSRVATRTHMEAVPMILDRGEIVPAFDDAHFPNDRSVKPSYMEGRGAKEMRLFGNHPVYGYVALDDENLDSIAKAFGEVKITLKDEVRDRTTVTYSDSMFINAGAPDSDVIPRPINQVDHRAVASWMNLGGVEVPVAYKGEQPRPEPIPPPDVVAKWEQASRRSWGGEPDPELLQIEKNQWLDKVDYRPWRHGDFIEAQIHGRTFVDDIERIDFPTQPSQKVIDRLRELNIPWTVGGPDAA